MKRNDADFTSRDVDKQFRPIPFWSWNDELKKEELLRQIHEMDQAGMGGFIMHARGGLKTGYLSEQWLDCISFCTREALKLGMYPYLYDENGWPSGFGDGKVNGLGEKYQQKCLAITERTDRTASLPDNIIAAFDKDFKLSTPEQAAYIVHYRLNPYYVDTMDPEVTNRFIEFVYEYYYRTLPDDVRNGITGIFTDEPQISRSTAPWSWTIEQEYRKEYGEELLPLLIELFYETGNFKRTRIRYYRLCAQLFRHNFIEKLGKWCKDHNWELTGHHSCEETFAGQLYSNGAIMPQYCGYSIPGKDHLGRTETFLPADIQLVSTAAQLGKKQILTETFGCSGWNFNMRGMEWLYQQQLVHGINYLCQHLEGYSLRGLRKRDYPMSVFYQHPMWKNIRPLNDAFSRVGGMLASGRIESDIVIYHGQSSAYIAADGIHYFTQTARECWCSMQVLSEKLYAAGAPCHYADEILTSEMGNVRDGLFHIGEMSYREFLLPKVINISAKILDMLKDFHHQGGKIRVSKYNDFETITVDGEAISKSDMQFLNSLETFDEYQDDLKYLTEHVRTLDCKVLEGHPGQVCGTWRSFPERNEHWYFIADFASIPENEIECDWKATPLHLDNPGNESPVKCEITLPYPADELWCIDQVSGKPLFRIRHLNISGKAKFFYEFAARSSILVKAVNHAAVQGVNLTDNWKITDGCNVLLLDHADYRRSDDGLLVKDCYTLSIFERSLARPNDRLELFFHFNCSADFDFEAAKLAMAIEYDPTAEYYLNGHRLKEDFTGYFIDRGIRVLALPIEFLKEGENEFKIVMQFLQSDRTRASMERAKHFESEANKLYFDSEIEAIYLLGNFSCHPEKITRDKDRNAFVSKKIRIKNMPETVSLGSLIEAGFIFFSGHLKLSGNFELTEEEAGVLRVLKFTPLKANSVTVTLNGKELPTVYTAPYQLDVSGLLKPGNNTIQLELATSCRNTFGPMHTAEIEPLSISPVSFLMEKDHRGNLPPECTEEYGVLENGFEICLQ